MSKTTVSVCVLLCNTLLRDSSALIQVAVADVSHIFNNICYYVIYMYIVKLYFSCHTLNESLFIYVN
jgi:hypothetical protein